MVQTQLFEQLWQISGWKINVYIAEKIKKCPCFFHLEVVTIAVERNRKKNWT